jgi:Coenzyme PQQ synthesis protein D (PqqD)
VSDLRISGPRARSGLDVNEVPDGLVIYDGGRDRVHYLNPTAGLIFCFCTGENSEATIAEQVGEHFSLDHLPTEETENCLANLRREGLID